MAEATTEHKPEEAAAPKFDPMSFPLKAIMGQKVGMTQVFTETGQRVPVSVVYTGTCRLTQIKTVENDGYNAVQMALGEPKEKNLAKPFINHFKKKEQTPAKWLKEFRVAKPDAFKVGQSVPVQMFIPGDYVDVSGTSRGKGFAGVMKRHNFAGLPTSHGASDKVRSRGSSGGGSGQPQRVFKGTGMAGRMGSDWITTQSIEVVKVDPENQLLLIKGALPGAVGGMVVIRETIKNLKHKRTPVAKATKKTAAKKPAGGAKPAAPAAKK